MASRCLEGDVRRMPGGCRTPGEAGCQEDARRCQEARPQSQHPTAEFGTAALQPPPPTDDSSRYGEEVQAGFRQLRTLFAAMDAGQETDFESVRGRPGVVLEPMPWQQLVSLIADGSPRALGRLGRHPLGIKRYWDHRDKVLLQRYASVTDYLLLDIFGLQSELAPDGRLVATVPPHFFLAAASCSGSGGDSSSGDSGGSFQLVTKWRENDFPYHLPPGTVHLNLWANRPLSCGEVAAHIAERVPHGAQLTWFVNPPSLQSVPAIWHAHVLYRLEGDQHQGGLGGQQQQQAQQQQEQAQKVERQQHGGSSAASFADGHL